MSSADASGDRRFRQLLFVAAGFNGLGALAFACPASLGALMGLPATVPGVYRALATGFIVLFGGLYAWLAAQPVIPRAMIGFSALGKSLAFAIFLGCGIAGTLPWRGVLLGSGDLVFAALFLAWLRRAHR